MNHPITVCLYTSTLGHFGRKDIYQRTVGSLQIQIGDRPDVCYLASVKYGTGEEKQAEEMEIWLNQRGFDVSKAHGDWSHGKDSHQIGFLSDQWRLNQMVRTEYVLVGEDDWITSGDTDTFNHCLSDATHLLWSHPEIMQVRIPRYSNEPDRINNLRAKHGINTRAEILNQDQDFWISGDWSNNPHIARTRDVRAALSFVKNSNLPKHSEHGISAAMKAISGAELPFAFFDPSIIRCFHLGTPEGQEDDISKPLLAELA